MRGGRKRKRLRRSRLRRQGKMVPAGSSDSPGGYVWRDSGPKSKPVTSASSSGRVKFSELSQVDSRMCPFCSVAFADYKAKVGSTSFGRCCGKKACQVLATEKALRGERWTVAA